MDAAAWLMTMFLAFAASLGLLVSMWLDIL